MNLLNFIYRKDGDSNLNSFAKKVRKWIAQLTKKVTSCDAFQHPSCADRGQISALVEFKFSR